VPSELTVKTLDGCLFSNKARRTILFSAFLLGGLVVILYGPVLRSMARQWWDDPNYGHALLVPIFAGYILWRKRNWWYTMHVRPSDFGLAIMLSAIGLLILGVLGAELFTTRVSLLILISGTIVFLAGWRALRSVAFPIAYLIFMIPLPALVYYQMTFPLQLWASRLGANGLVMLGVHTVREGNLIILPNITLEVVEACSGVRSLLSLLAAVVAYGYLAETSMWKRCLLVALTIPIVILSNGLRLVAMGLLSAVYGLTVDTPPTHTALGLAFFAFAFISIVLIHLLLCNISSRMTAPGY